MSNVGSTGGSIHVREGDGFKEVTAVTDTPMAPGRKFRRRSTVIEAEQLVFGRPLPKGVQQDDDGLFVITIHGDRTPVVEGDWILPEPDGEHYYPCKPDVFANTYEPLALGS